MATDTAAVRNNVLYSIAECSREILAKLLFDAAVGL